MGGLGLQMENQVKGEVETETTVVYKSRIHHVQGSLGGPPPHPGEARGVPGPVPGSSPLGWMVAERCKYPCTHDPNVEGREKDGLMPECI